MHILALETASDLCSVAILNGQRAEVMLSIDRPKAHARHLAGLVQAALRLAEVRLDDLEAVAVSSGPGSYTGLRIGVSTAKGLCYAAGPKLIGVPTLEAVATSAAPGWSDGTPILVLTASRRGEVYAACFEKQTSERLDTLLAPAAVKIDALVRFLEPLDPALPLVVTGNALGAVTPDYLGFRPVHRISLSESSYSAVWVGRLATRMLADGHHEDLAAFEPFYMKPFAARRSTPIFDRLPDMSSSRHASSSSHHDEDN